MKIFLFVLLLLPVSAWAEGGLPNQPYLYVEGTGSIERPADQVTLTFTLGATEKDAGTANDSVQAQATKMLALLDRHKIAERDVIAVDLESEPVYQNGDDDSSGKRGPLIGYHVTRDFSVVVREVAAFPALANELMKMGVEKFSGIEAGLSNQKQLADQAWNDAVADARQRADKVLAAEKMKIDSVYAISPVSIPAISDRMVPGQEGGGFTEEAVVAALPKLDPTQYRLPPIHVEQTLHLLYLISPVK